jgi:hypothetical protein
MLKRNCYKPAIVLVVLALTILAGVNAIVYAQSSNAQLQDERGIFNPFTLNVVEVSSDNGSVAVASSVVRPAIRIPTRPVLRSFFRPPMITLVP